MPVGVDPDPRLELPRSFRLSSHKTTFSCPGLVCCPYGVYRPGNMAESYGMDGLRCVNRTGVVLMLVELPHYGDSATPSKPRQSHMNSLVTTQRRSKYHFWTSYDTVAWRSGADLSGSSRWASFRPARNILFDNASCAIGMITI